MSFGSLSKGMKAFMKYQTKDVCEVLNEETLVGNFEKAKS